MESNAMPGGIYSNVQPGMLGLEMSLHHPLPPQNPQNPHLMPQQQPHPHPHHPMVAYGHHEGDYHPQTSQSVKQGYPSAAKSKNQSLTLSDDDEPGFTAENSADDGKRKMSPLLIMVVFYIGDEVGSEGNDPAGKKKGGGVLQKKGKWKSVSRAMMERGFYVSPQQCEDKFNDLNKRYKRVNDILGKGTSCRVVENQSLLDTMDHLSPKMKEEVKKLLNSKHLFFREMCAYHSSCGHGSGASVSGTGGVQHSPPEAAAEPSQAQLQGENEGSKLAKGTSGEDDDDDDDDDDDEDDVEEEDEDDEVIGGGSRVHERGQEDDINDTDERSSRKKLRKGTLHSPLIQQLDAEIMNMLQDGTKRAAVGIQSQSFELEKQRLKWLKFSSKKEREMEREKLTNERLKLENERMLLLIRQKELDLLDLHQQQQQHSSNKKSDPSSITG
ncbi:hypothetical protein Pfo_028520 [Paulownia fortunei]|nr:hypothetical protein Pfo_028520 [Paulownia fortunei]